MIIFFLRLSRNSHFFPLVYLLSYFHFYRSLSYLLEFLYMILAKYINFQYFQSKYDFIFKFFFISLGCPHGVIVKAMDCGIVVSKFVLQSCYYVHFRINTLGKDMNPLSSQLWVKEYHYCSRRIALALNNLQKLKCH